MTISPITFWLILALILAGLEMLSGTFYLLAVSVGMVCGALAAWIGLSLPTQMIIAAIVGIIAVIILHRWRSTHLPPAEPGAIMEFGQRVRILDWQDERHARVQYRGSQWDAELAPHAKGGHADYFIVAIHGAMLIIDQHSPEQN